MTRVVFDWLLGMLVTIALVASMGVQAAVPHVELDVRLDPERGELRVQGTLSLPPGPALRIRLWGGSEVASMMLDGAPLEARRGSEGKAPFLDFTAAPAPGAGSTVAFAYRMPLGTADRPLDYRQVLGMDAPWASRDGVFVPAGIAWHPQPEGRTMTHRITLEVAGAMRALVPGRLVEEHDAPTGYRAVFDSAVPVAGIDLLAGPYRVAERRLAVDDGRSIRLRTYLHEDLGDLSEPYLEAAARYLARYDRLIGPHLHGSYSIVSAPLPTGFGMPGIAYLGRQVLRLPFIRETSLGHEVLHDWWGNGVYPDVAHGNWSEGLTTFLADYAYKEDEGQSAPRLMREAWLRDYAAVPAGQDRALAQFVSRRHGADQAVGYNKTAFVFFMLRDWIGEEAFRAGLQALWKQHAARMASWRDLQRAFEAASRRDLGEFFRQWVARPGAPVLRVASVRRVATRDGNDRIRLVLRQEGTEYRLRVPVRVHLDDGRAVDAFVSLRGAERRAEISVPGRAAAIVVDPEARVFRRVETDEVAPILRQVMLDPRARVVTGSDADTRQAALAVAQAVLEQGVRTVDVGAAIKSSEPLLVAARSDELPALLERLGLSPVPALLAQAGAAFAYAERTREGRHYIVVSAPDADAMRATARSLPHLGAQSYATFEGGRSVQRGVWPAPARRIVIDGS